MCAGYTRQSTFSNGDVIDAPEVNAEFDQLVNAFVTGTGHNHNGDPANGGLIPLISNPDRSARVEITQAGEVQATGNVRATDVFVEDVTATGTVSTANLTATGTTTVAGVTGSGDITTTANVSAADVTSTGTLNANNLAVTGTSTVVGVTGSGDITTTANMSAVNVTSTGILSTANLDITGTADIKSYVETTETTATDSQLDFQDGNVHVRTPTAATTYTLENIPTTGSTKIELFLTNNGQTITWPNVTWEITGSEPTLGIKDRIIFSKYEGDSTIYALHVAVEA